MKRTCEQCKKIIRTNSSKAIYLGFLREHPRGAYEVWVCNSKCLKGYNEGEDIPEGTIHENPVRDTVRENTPPVGRGGATLPEG